MLSLSLATGAARADEEADKKKAQASNFFDAGVAAYKAGEYLAAAQAFEKAYALFPRGAIIFSAAQATKRQYLVHPTMETLRHAIELYREYLRVDPKAGRREEAMEALTVLVPISTRIKPTATGGLPPDGDGENPPPDGAPPQDGAASPAGGSNAIDKNTARILISGSAPGSEIALDGQPFKPSPLIANVSPGPHKAKVRAPGHSEEEVAVQAIAGEIMPQSVELRPNPGQLKIEGTSGARVSVDSKPVATLPTRNPISVEHGSRFVAVTLRGYEPWSKTVDVGIGKTVPLKAELTMTTQRKLGWAVLSAGLGGALAGGILGGFALDRQSTALTLNDKLKTPPIVTSERDQYNIAVRERNNFGQAAAIAGAASVIVLAVSVGMLVLDEPEAPVPDAPSGTPQPKDDFPLDVSVTPNGVRLLF